METNELTVAKRHENIEMLSELLDLVREYDAMVADCHEKRLDVEALDREIARPRPTANPFKVFFLGLITLGIGWIVALILHFVKKAQWKRYKAELAVRRDEAQAILDAALLATQEYYKQQLEAYINTLVPDRFPWAYATNANAIEIMRDMMVNLRADTIKEAINLYEEFAFRVRLENMVGSVVSNTASAAVSAARSAAANERSAAANERAATAQQATAAAAAASAAAMASMARSAKRTAAANERAASAVERAADN